jgi:hypothetical protein
VICAPAGPDSDRLAAAHAAARMFFDIRMDSGS